jgi:hypothetical protein
MVALEEPAMTPVERASLVLVQAATWLLLVTVAVSRYANLEPWGWGRRKWLSDRTRALAWAQWRQALPLGILAIATLIALSPVSDNGYLLAFFGGVWAIIVGVTMFAAELEPRLYTFWRSRPIDPSNWFRVKYVAGASIALLCFDLPGAWVGHSYNQVSRFEDVIPYLICVPLLHLSVYSVAVMMVCLVRQTVYAGILSMSAMLLLVLLPSLPSMHQTAWQPLNVSWMMSSLSEAGSRAHPTSSILTSLLIYLTCHATVVVAATLAAWSSVKYDVAVRM